MKLEIVDCFCTENENSGNRAAVIMNFTGSKEEKQQIAQDLNLPVTVFIFEEKSELPILEYFYPHTEMPLCIHGTIAAAKVVSRLQARRNLHFITQMNNFELETMQHNETFQIKVTPKTVPTINIDRPLICQMLNLDSSDYLDTTLPLNVASVGSPKLLVPLIRSTILANLTPDFTLIKKWSIENAINGLYVYAYNSTQGADFIARGFNPKTGHNEDAATGVAAAALTLTLKRTITVEQGVNLGRPCRIVSTYVNDSCILVGGKATFKQSY